MKPFRQHLLSAAAVFALTVAMLAAFPVEAIRFKAVPAAKTGRPVAAFVVLNADAEAKAVKSAKTAWQGDSSVRRHVGSRLPLDELPAIEKTKPLVDMPAGTGLSAEAEYAEYVAGAWTHSEAAEAPAKIAVSSDDPDVKAFSREELLGFDKKEDRK